MTTNHEEAVRLAESVGAEVTVKSVYVNGFWMPAPEGQKLIVFWGEELTALIAEVRRDVVTECAVICDDKAKLCATYLPMIVLEGAAEEIRAKLEEGK